MRFLACPHATRLDVAHLDGEGPEPAEVSEDAALLQRYGDAHEAAHLARGMHRSPHRPHKYLHWHYRG